MSTWVLIIVLLSKDWLPLGITSIGGWHQYEDCEGKARYYRNAIGSEFKLDGITVQSICLRGPAEK